MLPGKKKSENGNERRLQTVREVKQELNLQDQAECLSGADSDWEKDVLWLYLHLKGL